MNKKAFTLIELMVVVSIIGILLTLAIPTYNKQILKGRADEAKSMIQAIAFAQERYKQERGDYYPPITATETIKNEALIYDELKIDLSKSNNFNYFLVRVSGDENYEIKAILRVDNSICADKTKSTRCKNDDSTDADSWVDAYTDKAENKYYLSFKYPQKIDDDYSVGGVSYEYLYGD
ncbi:MAG: prepilin-type N-terminal cleavage/methylation domain-containing protein [Campylobacterota bacterium]|nr:prepilin-type N-terminal cleavage/methylation domain-containing protein [Campylobacterota bacterium]